MGEKPRPPEEEQLKEKNNNDVIPVEEPTLESPTNLSDYRYMKKAREVAIELLKKDLEKEYKEIAPEVMEKVLAQPEIKDSAEKLAETIFEFHKDTQKTLQEWEEKRKRLIWGIIDPEPTRNMINKIKSFFKK